MSIYGRSLVSKVSMASHLWYIAQFTSSLDSNWEEVWKCYWKYLLPDTGKCKIAYKDAIKKRINGGIGAINIKKQIEALKVHWIVRMFKDPDENWAKLFEMEINHLEKINNLNNWITCKWNIKQKEPNLIEEVMRV